MKFSSLASLITLCVIAACVADDKEKYFESLSSNLAGKWKKVG